MKKVCDQVGIKPLVNEVSSLHASMAKTVDLVPKEVLVAAYAARKKGKLACCVAFALDKLLDMEAADPASGTRSGICSAAKAKIRDKHVTLPAALLAALNAAAAAK